MQSRTTRLDSNAAHARTDTAEIRRTLRARRARARATGDRSEYALDAVFVALESRPHPEYVAALWLYFALATGTLGAMARSFGWI